MVKYGCSADSGSWKIIAISRPRSLRTSSGSALSSSLPSSQISPERRAFCAPYCPTVCRPMMPSEVTDLPEPDSPTMPRVLPFSSEKVSPSTDFTSPSSVGKWHLEVAYFEEGAGAGEPAVDGLADGRGSGLRRGRSCEPHSGVDHGVQQVHDEVRDDDDEGGDQRDAEDHAAGRLSLIAFSTRLAEAVEG